MKNLNTDLTQAPHLVKNIFVSFSEGLHPPKVDTPPFQLQLLNFQKLNWKVSIVDLLKLLGLESSFAARKELAVELGCPSEKMGDSAQMNMWLHKTVLQKLADNGGNIPKELLD